MNFQTLRYQRTDITARYYQITIMLRDKSVHSGVRENAALDIDSAYLLFRNKAMEIYGDNNVIYFQCVQLSKHSDEYKNYMIRKAATAGRKRNQKG